MLLHGGTSFPMKAQSIARGRYDYGNAMRDAGEKVRAFDCLI